MGSIELAEGALLGAGGAAGSTALAEQFRGKRGADADDGSDRFGGQHHAAFRKRQADTPLSIQQRKQRGLMFQRKIPIAGAEASGERQCFLLLQKSTELITAPSA